MDISCSSCTKVMVLSDGLNVVLLFGLPASFVRKEGTAIGLILTLVSLKSVHLYLHCPVFVLQMVLVIIFIIAVIMYRVLISIPLFKNKTFRNQASSIASMTSAIVNLILIMALAKVYEKLALKLTQWGKVY